MRQTFLNVLFIPVITLITSPIFASSMPNFKAISSFKKRQASFFQFLKPLAAQKNAQILQTRHKIINLLKEKQLTANETHWLAKTAAIYQVSPWNRHSLADKTKLLNRVDIVPTSLVLAQAAIESAWGTSRFARQGNNLFGQWCYTQGCGIVPRLRPAGRTYEVKKFSSVEASIASYYQNLNTNRAYYTFRHLRASLRRSNQKLSGARLTQGLANYSQEGQAYVQKIRWMIQRYAKLDHTSTTMT